MILAQIDKAADDTQHWEVLAPKGVDRPDWLTNVGFRTVGTTNGHIWEQTALYRASRRGRLVNLCNSGPILHSRSLTVLHDAWVFRHPDHFSLPYRIFHQSLDRMLARRSRIATVSHFSRSELADVLGIDPAKISVVPNAANHIDVIVPDRAVVDRLGLTGRRYLLLVGSFARNKNMRRAIEAFTTVARPEERLVIVGAAVGVFADSGMAALPDTVFRAGRVKDDDLVALYMQARALVFPSLYEGFGIPPLEAMRLGVPVIASNIGPVTEVCGDAALYFDPLDVEAMGTAMRAILDDDALHSSLCARALTRADAFSWDVSSRLLRRSIDDL
ncbi:glycosyltransferase family 1 protein [soil metagenome]